MSYSYWTEKEINTLVKMWPDHSIADIAKAVNRSRSGVQGKALGLKLPSKSPAPFTPDEDRFITLEREYMTNTEIGYHLDRTEKSITNRIRFLGLPHKRCNRDILIDKIAAVIGQPVAENLMALRKKHSRKVLCRMFDCEMVMLGQVIVYLDGKEK